MDREEYADFLELKNGYCKCPELMELFSRRKKCEALSEMDKIDDLRRFVSKYYAKISVLANKNIIEAVCHKGPDFSSEHNIPISQIYDHNTPENVITLHYSKCG